MGVHGLWRLIEPSGKPVPIETLENQVLAVDVSIWLHQAVKGFQDARGQPVPNAHLLSLYHRICKLLYFKIRPVFVFDGGVPMLKKQVIAKRSQVRFQKVNEANNVHKQLIRTLLKHAAVNKILSENTKAKIKTSDLVMRTDDKHNDDIYKLPPSQIAESSASEDENENTETSSDSSPTKQWDLHTIDEQSKDFKALPLEMRHDILTELKETRKQSSWGRIHEMPQQSDGFSGYQMRRLLKRHSVQVSLEEIEKEMGGHSMSLGELEAILKDQGVIETQKSGQHIASDENTRYYFIKDVQKAIENAKKIAEQKEQKDGLEEEIVIEERETAKTEGELDEDLSKAIALSLQEEAESADKKDVEEAQSNTDKDVARTDEFDTDLKKAIELSLQDMPSTSKAQESFVQNYDEGDYANESSSDSDTEQNMLAVAKNYMLEYSGLTSNEISKILGQQLPKKKNPIRSEKPNLKNLNVVSNSASAVNDLSDNNNKESNKSSNDEVELMSDSGSDDFIEADDSNTKEIAANKHLEIVISPDANLEEDLFADIFQNDAKNDALSANTSVTTSETSKEQECLSSSLKTHTSNANQDAEIKPSAPEEEIAEIEETQKEVSSRKEEIKEVLTEFMEEHSGDLDGHENAEVRITTTQLEAINSKLETHKNELISKRAAKERLASNITDQMYQEAQELLELFGLPYIIAPMEAEAQCAFLNAINLTNGTITDDSDIWLFGGKTVYKNFFNQQQFVKEFKAEDIKHTFKLSREQMVLLALLVGSDYTNGIQGIGPVTALEVLAAFPPKKSNTDETHQLLSGLEEFRVWLQENKKVRPGRIALRNKLKNVEITEQFPNLSVIEAYLNPCVDNSKEQFSWGKPDIVALIDFAKSKFGWTRSKSEEILRPVLKRMLDSFSQKPITDYFKVKCKTNANETNEIEIMMSKRVKKAVEKIGKGGETSISDEELEVLKETKKRSKRKQKEIETEVQKKIEKVQPAKNIHKKEVIPQREKDKSNLLRNKLKAIEVFRKSKQGPGYVSKNKKVVRKPKEDAELSESSNSE